MYVCNFFMRIDVLLNIKQQLTGLSVITKLFCPYVDGMGMFRRVRRVFEVDMED